jgi:uncharacterized iron-regulated membrane protein
MTSGKKHKTGKSNLKKVRLVHRYAAGTLFVFFIFLSVTGILLGMKKHSSGRILPETMQGTTSELSLWLPLDSLQKIASIALHESAGSGLSDDIDRIDVRKEKGIVKFTFLEHYWEVQVDGASGEVLQVRRRWADLIENLHDGSIVDHVFGLGNDHARFAYTLIMGTSLLVFTITGFWLWISSGKPKKRRRDEGLTN